MKLLLDTHILLWASLGIEKLSSAASGLLTGEDHEFCFSAASLWGIAIKRRLERPGFVVDPRVLRRALIDNGYIDLPVTADHAIATLTLPPIHKDPFDRLLIAQATFEGFLLVTSDATVARYPGPIQRV